MSDFHWTGRCPLCSHSSRIVLPKVINPLKFEKKKAVDQELDGVNSKPASKNKKKESTLSDDEFVSDYDDNDYVLPVPVSERDRRKKKLARQTKRKDIKEQKEKGEENDEIEIVPQLAFEDYDFDELATTRVLAQKMLRQKDREQIIEDSYNRYSKPEDEDAPDWFAEDERRHNFKTLPITKEEFQAEKLKILQLKSRPIKKIVEAKFRRKMQVAKKMDKAKVKAKQIFEQEGISEGAKMRQVQNLYKKQLAETKKEKKYVVSRKFKADKLKKNVKSGRFQKLVDKRLKKDKRADKRLSAGGKKIKKGKARYSKR